MSSIHMVRLSVTALVVFMMLFFRFEIANAYQTSGQNVWSEPEILFMLPDSVDGSRYLSAHVDNGEIILLSNYIKRTSDLHALEFSYVIQTRASENVAMSEKILSDRKFLAEGSVLYNSENGEWHALWGERREDPNFERWETNLPRINLFSTSLMYSSGRDDEIKNATDIFNGGISDNGLGAIRPPEFHVKVDESDNLHIVLTAWRFHEKSRSIMPFITYLRKKHDRSWENARFPVVRDDGFSIGVEGDIETFSEDQLIIAFLGVTPDEQQGNNDVLIVTSDDNGDTWHEPKAIFLSGSQPAKLVRLYKDKENRLHLLWGRQIEGLPSPDEMWHSTSEDGGDTWTIPERFLVLEKPPGVQENGILDYDVVSDGFGCIHWVARTFELPRSIDGDPSLYVRWCSINERWQEPEILPEISRGITFAPVVDEEEEKLYLFWTNEVDAEDQLTMFFSAKDLSEPVLPPSIAKSGPLQLHANYPNPFNPSTRISFTLEEPAEVLLTVFDISGRQILQKDLGSKPAGLHTEEVSLEGFTSGTYIYEVELNNTWRQQSTMMLIK